MRPSAAPSRLCLLLAALIVSLSASPAAAQFSGRAVVDSQTGEPVPFGVAPPPAEARADARGGGSLVPVQYLPSGSTKLVRFTGALDNSSGAVFFQDGGALVSGELNVASGDDFVQDTFVLPAQPSDAVVAGDLAYVSLRKNRGLLILDVSDPEGYVEVGRIEGRDLLSVTVAGDYAYAGQGESGIVVYDVSVPTAPAETATLASAGSANGTFVDGTTLYVAAGTAGLRTFDLSDPASPAALGSLATNDVFATNVVVRDDVAWLTGDFGLITADVSDPATPAQIGSFGTGDETTFEIAFDGDTAYLPGLDGLRTLDVSNPAAIQQLALLPFGQAFSVAINPSSGATVFTERFGGLYLLEGAPETPSAEQLYENAGFANKVDFDGDLLYVTDLAGRLRIIDTSGAQAVEIGRVDVPTDAQSVQVEGSYAYVAAAADGDETSLTIVDVSAPTSPVVVGAYADPNPAFGLDVVAEGDAVTVYLASGPGGLVVLDASDPQGITELGVFTSRTPAVDVQVRGGIAYVVGSSSGVFTLDVSDPANVTQLDAEEFGSPNAIDLGPEGTSGPFAYIADGGDEQGGALRVVDISDPANLASMGTDPTFSQARDVTSTVGFNQDAGFEVVYIADDFFGIREYTGSADKTEVASFESGDRGIGVAAQEGVDGPSLVALAAGEVGVYLFEAPFTVDSESDASAAAFALRSAFPNPFRDATTIRFTLPDAADVTLAVYDVLGRRVATLEDGRFAAGDHETAFDAAGLPSGVFLVRLDAGAHHATHRIVRVR